jgi:hypothetical protein
MATTLALRPRSPSEIVDTAVQILKAHYGQFVLCSALVYSPWLLVELLVMESAQDMLLRGWRFSLATTAVSLVVFSIMSALLVSCASRAYLGEEVDVAAVVREMMPRMPRVVVATLFRYLFIGIGFLGLFVGSLYFLARYFAVTPAIVLEDAGIGAAFARSTALSHHRKRHIINALGLIGVIYWVLGMGLSMLTLAIGNFQLQLIAGAVFTILAYPVIAITGMLLYYDARIQDEGLDIEMMAAALG